MEQIYANIDDTRSQKSIISTNPTGPTSSERRRPGAVVLSLSLLSVFLLAGLIGLGVHYHGLAAEFSSVKANLTEERDQLNSTLIEVTKKLELQRLSQCNKTCPSEWTLFSCSCYLLSTGSGFWAKGRKDCRGRGADLVVIDSTVEQTFLFGLTSNSFWIGLTDAEKEGEWKWVDGTPLTLAFWAKNEPDNGVGDSGLGEEDCAHIRGAEKRDWNDVSCNTFLKWICEKKSF